MRRIYIVNINFLKGFLILLVQSFGFIQNALKSIQKIDVADIGSGDILDHFGAIFGGDIGIDCIHRLRLGGGIAGGDGIGRRASTGSLIRGTAIRIAFITAAI